MKPVSFENANIEVCGYSEYTYINKYAYLFLNFNISSMNYLLNARIYR